MSIAGLKERGVAVLLLIPLLLSSAQVVDGAKDRKVAGGGVSEMGE